MTRITTNNQARELLSLYDFSVAEQQQLRSDYDWMDLGDLEGAPGFFRYRSAIYHLQDFIAIRGTEGPLGQWDGYLGESAFSGVVIRMFDDCESVVAGRYLS